MAFDENTPWGQLNIGELKGLALIALKRYEDAKPLVEMFLTFNDNSTVRKLYYQAVNALLDIALDEDLEVADYAPNMIRMFGKETFDNALGTVTGEIRFFGLTKTNSDLLGLDKHLKLIESYQKLQSAKRKFYSKA